jgi:hypothetical protein
MHFAFSPRIVVQRTYLFIPVIIALNLPAQTPAPMPESVLYSAFLREVAAQERFGDHLDAQGKKSDSVRGGFRQRAQLTPAEDATMKAIAKN